MRLPTDRELRAAYAILNAPGAGGVEELAGLVGRSPAWKAMEGVSRKLSGEHLTPLAALRGGMLSGIHLGLLIGEIWAAEAGYRPPAPTPPPEDLAALELYAWVGRDDGDEPRTQEIGLKIGIAPAGRIPLVATRREKVEKFWPEMEGWARRTGIRRRLARFRFVESVRETEGGPE